MHVFVYVKEMEGKIKPNQHVKRRILLGRQRTRIQADFLRVNFSL